jgi:hypothetical protein
MLCFLLLKVFVETVSLGFGCIISTQSSQHVWRDARIFASTHRQILALCCLATLTGLTVEQVRPIAFQKN